MHLHSKSTRHLPSTPAPLDPDSDPLTASTSCKAHMGCLSRPRSRGSALSVQRQGGLSTLTQLCTNRHRTQARQLLFSPMQHSHKASQQAVNSLFLENLQLHKASLGTLCNPDMLPLAHTVATATGLFQLSKVSHSQQMDPGLIANGGCLMVRHPLMPCCSKSKRSMPTFSTLQP